MNGSCCARHTATTCFYKKISFLFFSPLFNLFLFLFLDFYATFSRRHTIINNRGVEYFEVYHGPITSTYGMVWWTGTSNPIPPEVVAKFDGKVMAIVGLEMDQVRVPKYDVINLERRTSAEIDLEFARYPAWLPVQSAINRPIDLSFVESLTLHPRYCTLTSSPLSSVFVGTKDANRRRLCPYHAGVQPSSRHRSGGQRH